MVHPELQTSEIEYLDREIADAKAALVGSMDRLKNRCVESVGLSHWIRNHVWTALGCGAVAGFAAARILTQKAGGCDSESAGAAETANGQKKAQPVAERYGRKKSRLSGKAVGAVFNLSKLLVEAALVAALRSERDSRHRTDDTQ
jgi:hypothetical protein